MAKETNLIEMIEKEANKKISDIGLTDETKFSWKKINTVLHKLEYKPKEIAKILGALLS